MPTYPRNIIMYDGAIFHLTWKCHNDSWFLEENWAKKFYYEQLLKWKDKYGISIYSYGFMDNHPHLAGETSKREGLSNFMKRVNYNFAKEYNRRNNRKGQVIMDRFKSPVIENDRHLLNVMMYIDLNACRAKKVDHPSKYKWSSYGYYAHGTPDPLITPAPSYLGLADTNIDRQRLYREMIIGILENDLKKRDYSKVTFIGNPTWVIKNHQNIKNLSTNTTPQQTFASAPP